MIKAISTNMLIVALAFSASQTASYARAAGSPTVVANIVAYGANGTDQKDDSAAIQKAIDDVHAKGGGTVYIPAGTYYLSQVKGGNSSLLIPRSNVNLKGDGAQSVLKVADKLNRPGKEFNVFAPADSTNANRVDQVQFDNFVLDLNGEHNLLPQAENTKQNRAIMIRFGSRITVSNMTFKNNPGQQTLSFGNNTNPHTVTGLVIRNSSFLNSSDAVPDNKYAKDHSSIYAQADNVQIERNYFYNAVPSWYSTAIESHSSHALISENYIENYSTGMNIVATATDHEHSLYRNNTIIGADVSFQFWTRKGYRMADVTLENNTMVQREKATHPMIDTSTDVQNEIADVRINGNSFSRTGGASAATPSGIRIGRVKTIAITHNSFTGLLARAVELGTIERDRTAISLEANTVVDCGKTTNAQPAYQAAFSFNGLNSIRELTVWQNKISNRSGAFMKAGISGNAPLAHAVIRDNEVTGIETAFEWDRKAAIRDLLLVQKGKGNPNGRIKASKGSLWTDTNTGAAYEKRTDAATADGWISKTK